MICSCNKLVDVKLPVDELVSSTVFADSATAVSTVNGMYSQLYNGDGNSIYGYRISTLPAESADELMPVKNSFDQFYSNSLVAGNSDVSDLWSQSYHVIYLANSIIDGLQASKTLSASLKNQLTAEAKFVRAFCDFYLVNYFGRVPIVNSSNVTISNNAPASSVNEVYAQMISDLSEARDALPADYSLSGGDRTRVNRYVASAMLARVYLYNQQWAQAVGESTNVIAQNGLYALQTDLNTVFLANSQEAIWQLYTNVRGCTFFAQQLIPTGLGVPNYTTNPILENSFETGDQRKSKWLSSVDYLGVTYTFPYKYKSITNNNTEFDMALRLSEQYLIRAEANSQLNNVIAAQTDLNVVRKRAGLAVTGATDKASLLLAVEHERQVELFCEYGHRWLDLKRTGQADVILKAEKPLGWQSTDQLYPIPQSARSTNNALYQNPGYN